MNISKIESTEWNRIVDMFAEGVCHRDLEVEKILRRRDFKAAEERIRRVKRRITELFPTDFEKCPLDPKITGVIHMDGYTIENTVIQSMPGYYVPVNVYVPDRKTGKMPAILVPMGHWPEGKRYKDIQILCANFALRGIVTAVFDPICQGERDMFPEVHSEKLGDDMWAVMQHLIPGIQCYLLGENLQSYFVWDGMRVIDYLCSRQDVDSERIGCTGQSGGGTQTQYLSVLDDRIKVASPIQSTTKPLWTMRETGVGDSEQSPFGRDVDFTLDIPDSFWAVFPKPLMLNIGLRDMFALSGLRHVEAEINALYSMHGKGERFAVYDDDCEHVITSKIRKNAYKWFTRWFFNEENELESKVNVLGQNELCCMKLRSKLTIDIVRDRMIEKLPKSPAKAEDIRAFISAGADECTVLPLDTVDGFETFILSAVLHQDAFCKLHRGSGRKLRVVLNFLPDSYKPELPSADEWVLEIKPFGYYNTVSKKIFDYTDESNTAIAFFLKGKSIFADRTSQILSAINFTAKQMGVVDGIVMDAGGQGGILSIAAALYDRRITNIKASGMPACYRQYFGIRDYLLEESAIIPGIMKLTDIPEMAALTGIHIELTGVTGPGREVLPLDDAKELYKGALNVNINQ